MLWTQKGFWIYQICCLCLSKCSHCSSVEGRQTHPITIQSSGRRWTRPLFIFQNVERHSSIRMTGRSFMEKREPRQERGKEAVGRGRGLWEQHRACSMGLPVCWDVCHLSRLELVIQQSSFSLRFLLFRQIERFFGCHTELISDLMPEDIRYEIWTALCVDSQCCLCRNTLQDFESPSMSVPSDTP